MVAKKSPRRKPSQRNPTARKYRVRQYDVAEWNVRAQRWEPLGRVSATTPKYAIEEFMASRPGYSRLHLRAEEIGATPRAKRQNPDRAITTAAARALGVKFGRAAVSVELRPEFADANRTRSALNYAVQELAFWELGESGHASSWDIQNDAKLQRAFYLGTRDAVREALADAPASRAGSRVNTKRRNPDSEADEWRFRLIEDINSWAFGTPEDMGVHRFGRYEPDVRRWTPIAKAAKVPMARLVASAKVITTKTPYVTAERRLELRSELAHRMTEHLRKASDADIERYAYFREDYMAEHEE